MFPEILTNGYRAFLDDRLPRERETYETLGKQGQKPEILLIGCCDSRVPPEIIFGAGPGDMFVVRNVANIVPPDEAGSRDHGTASAIEFAVVALAVKHVVVLGHAGCGGIKAYAQGAEPLSPANYIGKWVSRVEPAAESLAATGDARNEPGYLTRLEHAMIGQSIANLMTFPFVRERVERGELTLHGAHFNVAAAELLVRDPETGSFAQIVDAQGRRPDPSALIACSEA